MKTLSKARDTSYWRENHTIVPRHSTGSFPLRLERMGSKDSLAPSFSVFLSSKEQNLAMYFSPLSFMELCSLS